MAKRALITGITGQDGSYLAELLLGKGYEVHGIIRRASTFNTGRLEEIYADPHAAKARLFLHYGDLSDASGLSRLLSEVRPEEIYNLAAQSHVRVSFDSPEYTTDVTGSGTVRMLEAMRQSGLKARFYQASSSEMYGKVHEIPQSETRRFIRAAPTVARKCMRTGSLSIIGNPTVCTPATGFSSTTNRRGAGRRLSRARSRAPWPRSWPGCRTSFTWATWRPSATGATPKNMWRRCG